MAKVIFNTTISIITVCLNSQETIAKTIESVISQSCQNFEYIIIDGASTDNTLNIIKKYQEKYPIKLISEPDSGIYDAMNKGVKIANGKWILFLNSDDYLYDINVVNIVSQALEKTNCDILYGATEFRYDNFNLIKQPSPLKAFWRRMPFCHQSCYTKRSLLLNSPFNKSYKIAADYDFLIHHYKQGFPFFKIDEVLSSFSVNGLSEKSQNEMIKEYLEILKKEWGYTFKVRLFYKLIALKPAIKKIMPWRLKKIISRLKI